MKQLRKTMVLTMLFVLAGTVTAFAETNYEKHTHLHSCCTDYCDETKPVDGYVSIEPYSFLCNFGHSWTAGGESRQNRRAAGSLSPYCFIVDVMRLDTCSRCGVMSWVFLRIEGIRCCR